LQIIRIISLFLLGLGQGHAQVPLDKAKTEYEKKAAEQLAKYELKELKASILIPTKARLPSGLIYKRVVKVCGDTDSGVGQRPRLRKHSHNTTIQRK
jgi:hypothetical protein